MGRPNTDKLISHRKQEKECDQKLVLLIVPLFVHNYFINFFLALYIYQLSIRLNFIFNDL